MGKKSKRERNKNPQLVLDNKMKLKEIYKLYSRMGQTYTHGHISTNILKSTHYNAKVMEQAKNCTIYD